MIKGVIFDMDGVLVDNKDIHAEAFAQFLDGYGIEFDREDLPGFFGHGNEDIFPSLLPAEVIENKGLAALVEEKEVIYRHIFESSIEPTRGLIDFMEDLKRNNILMSVGSSGSKGNVDFVVDRCCIRDFFTVMVNADMVSNCKPDPEIFLTAAKLMGLAPEECLVIEDSFAGIEAARRAGMKVIGLATTFTSEKLQEARPDHIAVDFTELDAAIIQIV